MVKAAPRMPFQILSVVPRRLPMPAMTSIAMPLTMRKTS